MVRKGYGIYCPTSKACEVLEPRWTIQILCELWDGNTRFNEIRRALPGLSPPLLSKRLKELEAEGMIERVENRALGTVDYFRTEKAIELETVFDEMARWAQRHVDADIALSDRDAGMLMWKLRRRIDTKQMLEGRNVVRFHFPDSSGKHDTYWFVAEHGSDVDLCIHDPRHDPDLYVECEVGVLTGIYMGRRSLSRDLDDGKLFLSGDTRLVKNFTKWLPPSVYADVEGIAAAKPSL
ncbi:winged helix-turn-helix transcriptional regulator [Boseongicola aestuarii]|uniref:Putative HTH-type transcriptional regulator YtcD n=1 Tax=Boseongicola aestuarii TaxID=1470561 RepID=A0A238J565_9RHOB|nr:helix-turn-helix domain-containing protein [Boseongicola aestuarii]SMX25848.1 putative HTH-type transcriptional regulator YtcD [Boseongicola aestuarii]